MLTRTVRPARAANPRTFRPTLEALEGRTLLSGNGFFQQTNLVANEAGVARLHDPALVNAWGVSLSATGGAFWVSAEGTGVSTLYTGDVGGSAFAKAALTVSTTGGAPTGQVFNTTPDFLVQAGAATGRALFIFASNTGHITGWSPVVPAPGSRIALPGVATPGESQWTGLAIASTPAGSFLYAADFKNGTIDVFNGTFQPTTLAGNFTDPGLHSDFMPFNVQALGGKVYVTYARADRTGDGLPDGGSGFVSVFDTQGNFEKRLASHGHLDQPWGLALAPADFGPFAGALLVGNHGDGRINAFDPESGKWLGALRDERGKAIRIDGLWGLAFGNGVSAGDKDALYFAAGPDDGADGLFGSLRFVPEAPKVKGKAKDNDQGKSEDHGLAVALLGAPGRRLSGEEQVTRSPAGQRVQEELAELLLVIREGKAEGGPGAVLRSPRVRQEAADVIFALEDLFERR